MAGRLLEGALYEPREEGSSFLLAVEVAERFSNRRCASKYSILPALDSRFLAQQEATEEQE